MGMDEALDIIDALSSELDEAIKVAFDRGAWQWVSDNYPELFEVLIKGKGIAND